MSSNTITVVVLMVLSVSSVLCSHEPGHQDPVKSAMDSQKHPHAPLPHAFSEAPFTAQTHQHEGTQNLTTEHQKSENATSKISARQAPFPPPGVPPPVGGMPMFPGFGGLGAGLGGGLDFGLDAGLGGGILGGIFPYFPIIEKVIIIIGGGILILLFLALLHGLIWNKEGLLGSFGLGLSGSKAVAGAANLDVGPIHASTAGSLGAGASLANNAHFNDRVQQGINQRF